MDVDYSTLDPKQFLITFSTRYSDLLGKRADTFKEMFLHLLKRRQHNFTIVETVLKRRQHNFTIVETGTVRMEHNFNGDGCSTVIFDHFISTYGGTLHTVDTYNVRSRTPHSTLVTISDSVIFLDRFQKPETIDLLYLDSFDFDANNPHPSSLHHIKELATVWASLPSGCLIVIDDNFEDGSGKGAYIQEFMYNVGATPLFNSYQLGFIKP